MDFNTVNLSFKSCGYMSEEDRFMLAFATAIKETEYTGRAGGSGSFTFEGKDLFYTVWFREPVTKRPAITIKNDTYSLGDTIDWNGPLGYFLLLGFARLEIQQSFADEGRL